MIKSRVFWIGLILLPGVIGTVLAALVVPSSIELPGTQPREVGNLESPDKCDNCHGGYDSAVEPAYNWRGSMMANAGRDPIFWATVAIAEQDFDGSGDLCIRCHSTSGWLAGRSTPTDGSGLAAGDADGVDCDYCHKLTNPDNSEHVGVMQGDYIANDGGTPPVAYRGSGMSSIWSGNEKIGPYANTNAKHKVLSSQFHRSSDLCGTCHDVSNSVTGDVAHNNGAQVPLPPGGYSGQLGSDVALKAAFRNPPYAYGIVERTFSEHKSSTLAGTLVSGYASLPEDLKAGAILAAYTSASVAGTGGNYEDNTDRYFSCQTCHLPAVTGQGCNKNPPVRKDLPLHDMAGGNYWIPEAILWQDAQNKLVFGGGLNSTQTAAINAGALRAKKQLSDAVALNVTGDTLKVVNLTGHKVISGYPEGRRMWLNIKWYDATETLLREDGKYGSVSVTAKGRNLQVKTILNLDDPNTKIYESHYGMTKEWAGQLKSLGYADNFELGYDRVTGAVTYTLGQLAAQAAGTHHETFHFVLNNTVVKDNRIPPYGFSYNEAQKRNCLPVPAAQYGSPVAGGTYRYWDEVALNPPEGAVSATIDMLYQPTSWEYIQFLYIANNGSNAFLGNEGTNLLDAWLATGMAEPYSMAQATWSAGLRGDFDHDGDVDADDIDLLFEEVVAGTDNVDFDLAGNPLVVDMDDVDEHVQVILDTDYGDANLDGKVDLLDLSILAMNWEDADPEGLGWADGSFDGDNSVNLTDLSIMAGNWGFDNTAELAD